jgi:endonuclease IV
MSLGFHVSKNGRTMADALREDMLMLTNIGMSPTAQIFVTGPQSFKETLTPVDKQAIAEMTQQPGNPNKLTLVIHGAYVDHPWGAVTSANGSIHNIRQELRIAAEIGATGVIVHLGSRATDDAVLQRVLGTIMKDLVLPPAVTLWLEIHTAKPSAGTFETPAKLRRLFERIAIIQAETQSSTLRIGLCIDTAHLFSCGMALTTSQDAAEWLAGLPEVPTMLHLNDSASRLGSGIDKHAPLTEGGIWGAYARLHETSHTALDIADSGLNVILSWAEQHQWVVILERNDGGVDRDLALIHALGYFSR